MNPSPRLAALVAALSALLWNVGQPGDALGGAQIRAMTFNVRWDGLDEGEHAWVHRRGPVAELIRSYNPDVVALQEPSLQQTADLEGDLSGYTAINGEHERDQHLPILFRPDRWEVVDHGSFWLVRESPLSGGTRRCTWLRLRERESRFVFVVFNNHWDHRSADSRKSSAKALLEGIRNIASGGPFVVLGDFNETLGGSGLATLLPPESDMPNSGDPDKSPDRCIDAFGTVHPGGSDVGTGHGFTGRRNGARIDFIFCRAGDRVLNAQIARDQPGGRYPSDHYPVLADIEFADPRAND